MGAEKYVSKDKDGSWVFQCPGPVDSPCGVAEGPGFRSSGWPTKGVAVKRGDQHIAEHKTGEASQEMATFLLDNGLTTNPAGKVVRLEEL